MRPFLVALAAQTAPAAEPNIRMLDWMIGEWDFVDRALPVTGETYEERGTRRCAYVLDRRYIRCESRGTVRGRVRTYLFYLGYNPEQRRFEMLSMWGNLPGRTLHGATLSEDGRRLELTSDTLRRAANGEMRRGWATISYDGRASWVWNIGWAPDGEPRGEPRYRDIATRRPGG